MVYLNIIQSWLKLNLSVEPGKAVDAVCKGSLRDAPGQPIHLHLSGSVLFR